MLPLTFYTSKLVKCKEDAINRIRYKIEQLTLDKDNISYEAMVKVKDMKEIDETLNNIRIWPIDITSLSKLFVSAVLPGLPIVLDLLNLSLPSWVMELFGIL